MVSKVEKAFVNAVYPYPEKPTLGRLGGESTKFPSDTKGYVDSDKRDNPWHTAANNALGVVENLGAAVMIPLLAPITGLFFSKTVADAITSVVGDNNPALRALLSNPIGGAIGGAVAGAFIALNHLVRGSIDAGEAAGGAALGVAKLFGSSEAPKQFP